VVGLAVTIANWNAISAALGERNRRRKPRLSVSAMGDLNMVFHDIESRALASVAYDGDKQRLQVRFRDGSRYAYLNVTAPLYESLLAAPSPGQYFNTHIRSKFAHERESAAPDHVV
jgi:KTSC domain